MKDMLSFLSNLFLKKKNNTIEQSNKQSGAYIQGYKNWLQDCDQILAKPFPPQSSYYSFDEEKERTGKPKFSRFSNWEIICMEILDTEHSHIFYQKCYKELLNRGKTKQEIFEMRKFAWQTVGWLNFKMGLWEWVHLDSEQIFFAIDLLYQKKIIDEEKKLDLENFLKFHES